MSEDRIEIERTGLISKEPPAVTEPGDLLSVIAHAVADPRMDVEKMSKLLDMHERIMADQSKTAFMAAMARLQAKLPQINKDGRIVVKGTERSRYARIEDIDAAIRPLLAEEGFSFSFDEESSSEKVKRFSAKLSHRDGHFEIKYLTLPIDASEYRTGIQSVGSTTSYARRYLIKMHLNIVERGEDDDGNGGAVPISEDQARDLETMIQDVKADRKRFLTFMGVAEVTGILARDYQTAVTALETKKGQKP